MSLIPLAGRRALVVALAALASGCAQTVQVTPSTPSTPPGPTAGVPAPTPCVNGRATPAGSELSYECDGVDFLARVSVEQMDADGGNDIWGWEDPQTGREYALVGLRNGTFFVDVSTPTRPVLLGKLPTATVATVWRDIKVYRDHAFIVSEARDHGMQVFDLTRLRGLSEDADRRFEADARYTMVTNVHNIVINEETGFAYAVGATSRGENLPPACAAPGFHAINIQNPTEPTFAGCFSDASRDNSPVSAPGYTHDAQCVVYRGPDTRYTGREICFGSNEDVVSIFDVSDKASVRLLAQAEYPNDAYQHQGWLTEDQRFYVSNDELDEMNGLVDHQRTIVFDVSDLEAPEFSLAYDSGLTSIDHNLYIRDGISYQSNYESGVRIVDVRRVAEGVMEEIGFFDSYPQSTTAQFNGQWSNYPFFRSGILISNDINNGLFILQPDVLRRSTTAR